MSSMTDASAGPFDASAIALLYRFGGASLVGEMITVYLDHAQERLVAIRDGLVAGDRDKVRGAAHALKSSSAQLGAAQLGILCARAEEEAPTAELGALRALGGEIAAEFDRAADWLRTQLPRTDA